MMLMMMVMGVHARVLPAAHVPSGPQSELYHLERVRGCA